MAWKYRKKLPSTQLRGEVPMHSARAQPMLACLSRVGLLCCSGRSPFSLL